MVYFVRSNVETRIHGMAACIRVKTYVALLRNSVV